MIVSASRRTDIPCYYSDWFINRLNEGYVLTRNPMNHTQVSKIPLSSDVVDCIVFWTKDPKNMLTKLEMLEEMEYKYYFQFTLNPYGNDIEKNLRKKIDIEDTFIFLSKTIGKERVLWRYDPIILNDYLTIGYHKEQFKRLCERLYNYTKNVTISFVDMYRKLNWSAEKSNGEIDFLFQSGMDIVPLEVKATENLQAKSLKSYCLRYEPKYAIRTSMSDYRKEERLTNLPLYAINGILNILK